MPNFANCSAYPVVKSRNQWHKNTGIPSDAHCRATVDCTVKAQRVLLHNCSDGAPAITRISDSGCGKYFRSIRRCPFTLSKGCSLNTSFIPLFCANDHNSGSRLLYTSSLRHPAASYGSVKNTSQFALVCVNPLTGPGPVGSPWPPSVTRNVVRLQTGYLYHYAFAMLIGAAAFITWFMFATGSH